MVSKRPSIFISHSWDDKAFAKRLARDLEGLGIQVWIDDEEISLGDSIIEKIQDAIDSVDYLGVIISNKSIASGWVQKEIDIAMNHEIENRKVKVLALVIEKCPLPMFLKGKLYADFSDPARYSASLEMILKRVRF